MSAISSSSSNSTSTRRLPARRSTCWRASLTTSATSSGCSASCSVPLSIRVMDSRFSTSVTSQHASSWMSRYKCSFCCADSAPRSCKSMSASPEMLVNGVRRSCEMVRSRFARSVSFSMRISMRRLSSAKTICSVVWPHSSRMASKRFFSKAPKSSSPSMSSIAMPATPNTASFEWMGRYRHCE